MSSCRLCYPLFFLLFFFSLPIVRAAINTLWLCLLALVLLPLLLLLSLDDLTLFQLAIIMILAGADCKQIIVQDCYTHAHTYTHLIMESSKGNIMCCWCSMMVMLWWCWPLYYLRAATSFLSYCRPPPPPPAPCLLFFSYSFLPRLQRK